MAQKFAEAEADAGYSRGLRVAAGRNLLWWPLGHAMLAPMRKRCRPKTTEHTKWPRSRRNNMHS